jgi:valyl-tRNA synthetase
LILGFLLVNGQWSLQNTKQGDFERFYPTSVMETGYDILPFWVMRMLLLGIYKTGKSPFKHVYLHGLVRDQKGQKMSKSKGNVINPLEVAEQYGADSLRLALVIRSTPGQDKSVGEPDFKAARNLTNKLWNAARFVIGINEKKSASSTPKNKKNTSSFPQDSAFKEKLTSVTTETTTLLDNLQLGVAADYIYNEFWHWFCDECIEESKAGKISHTTLLLGLTTFLKLFHPFMPFVTEAIWQELRAQELIATEDILLITSPWPKLN